MIQIDRTSKIPLYKQLYLSLKQQIEEEEYTDAPLTPPRTLAKDLHISKNTVDQAYQQLLAEGYIYTIPGSGYYRNRIEWDRNAANTDHTPDIITEKKNAPVPKYNFQYGSIDNQIFPWSKWKKCVHEALQMEMDRSLLSYQDKQGLYSLRKSLASYLKASRGVNCLPEQIIICSGIHDTLSILTAILPSGEYRVGMENPGYDVPRNYFIQNRYTVRPISVNDKGIALDELQQTDANLIYVTPSHQFPTGCVMPIGNRSRLLHLLYERNGFIIEDDYDSEFRYGSSIAIPSLQSLDTHDRVIYIGTFSKSFSPTIRVSYMVLPRQLLTAYHKSFVNAKAYCSDLIQQALQLFLEKGFYVRHLRKMVLANEKKYNLLPQLLKDAENIEIMTSGSGVHCLVKLHSARSHTDMLEMLEENDIRLYPTAHYWHDSTSCPQNIYLLGYAAMSREELAEGIRHLIKVLG